MRKIVLVMSMTSVIGLGEVAFADTPNVPANVAPPISTIATFEGEYFCIYHDRIYSVGAAICVGKLGLQCSSGQFPGPRQPPTAAIWVALKDKDGDFCAGVTAPPIPQ